MLDYIDPRVNVAFRKLFGTEENKDILISLINSIVSADDEVKDLVILNIYNPRNLPHDKVSDFDVRAEGKSGQLYYIQMKVADDIYDSKCELDYFSQIYSDHLKKGDYSKGIAIHILNFCCVPDKLEYHNVYQLENCTGNSCFSNVELHTIELEKFEYLFKHEPEQLQNVNTSEKLLIFFAHYELFEQQQTFPNEINSSYLDKAFDVLEYMSFNKAELNAYEKQRFWLMQRASMSNQSFELWVEMLMGTLEVRRKCVIRFLTFGMDVKTISKITDTSVTEIKKLEASLMGTAKKANNQKLCYSTIS